MALARISRTAQHELQVRRYCARLLDLRCAADPAWRRQAPCSLLMETGQVVRVRTRRDGQTFEIKGRFASPPHRFTFAMLAIGSPALVALWLAVEGDFELEAVL